ncbi:MAG: inverse autotransporter beta domain-containing protein, partial [Planctomycetaceae bacterium]|nr:inverse autotransporter beta domain-containing protein [Planctomycetaceae bacterium]
MSGFSRKTWRSEATLSEQRPVKDDPSNDVSVPLCSVRFRSFPAHNTGSMMSTATERPHRSGPGDHSQHDGLRGKWMKAMKLCVARPRVDGDAPPGRSTSGVLLFASLICVVFSAALLPTLASAGGPPDTLNVSGMGPEYGGGLGEGAADPDFEVPGGGYGFLSRIGHIAGSTVGREESITHIGLAPYLFHEETMLFSDLRLFRTNDAHIGGSVGLGLRHYLIEQDAVLGFATYYDSDDSRGSLFKQLGVSAELLTKTFDVRANVYVPIEDTEKVLGNSIVSGSERFDEHLLLFDRRTDFASAADGQDVTVSMPVPGEIAEMFNLEVSAGGYHYQARQGGLPDVWGYKLRSDADVFKRILHMFVELTSDRQFDTRLIAGGSLNYYHGFENRRRLQSRQFYRMSEWVRRNYTVVTIDDFTIDPGEVARNPATGDPYYFAHVRNIPGADTPPPIPDSQPPFFNFPAPFGDGTVDAPFQFIQEAQADIRALLPTVRDNAIVYVHGDSEFTGDNAVVVMEDGEVLLGEGEADGVIQTLPVLGFTDDATLPVVIPDGSVPLLDMATGDAVTLASGNTFSGFNITNSAGNGITIDNAMGGTISDVTINGTGGDGIFMSNASELFTFENVSISDTTGIAFHIDGGSALVRYGTADNILTIENSSNEALLVENTTGGSVIFTNSIINDDPGGAGIRLLNNAATITLGEANITGTVLSDDPTSVGAGLEITGAAANITLLKDITIDDASGVGFLVQDLVDGGRVIPSANLTILNRNDIGADFVNIDGISGNGDGVLFSSDSNLIIGTLNTATVDHPAIRFSSGSTGTVSLNDFSIANSLGEGILIGDPNGVNINEPGALFRVLGGAIGSINATGLDPTPGMTGDTNRAAMLIAGADGMEDPTEVRALGTILMNTREGRGLHIEETTGLINFSNLTVNNNAATPSGFSALFINNTSSEILFGGTFGLGNFVVNDAIGPEPAVDIMNVFDPGSVTFNSLNIIDASGTTGLEVTDTSSLVVEDGVINVATGQAIDIENTGIDVTFESVSSSNSPTFGMRVVNSPGSFTITGVNSGGFVLGTPVPVTSSGGEISGAAIAGALFDFNNIVNVDGNIVDLQGQDYTDNLVGVQVQNMDANVNDLLRLSTMQFIDQIDQSVIATDVRNILIFNSVFTDGVLSTTLVDDQYIDLRLVNNPNNVLDDPLNTLDPDFVTHQWIIRANLFDDANPLGPSDGILVQTVGADAADASLEFRLDEGNLFTTFDRTEVLNFRPAALRVDWDGFLFADVRDNVVNMSGLDGQIGFNFITEGNDTTSEIGVVSNTITGGNGIDTENTTAIRFDLTGPNTVLVDNNLIDIQTTPDDPNDNTSTSVGVSNQGIEFRSAGGRTNTSLRSNIILMDAGTAVDVRRLSTPVPGVTSVFEYDNNIVGTDGTIRTDLIPAQTRFPNF